jgi:hypothetical protein
MKITNKITMPVAASGDSRGVISVRSVESGPGSGFRTSTGMGLACSVAVDCWLVSDAGLDVRLENPAGLTGVWAEENTRASLFEAMQRKETFATSGPRIQLRFFGGWDYDEDENLAQRRQFWKIVPDWIKDRAWTRVAYAQGVPMGSDLKPMPKDKRAPSFAVWAVKDPTSGNLDRIQIVKGWTKSGQSFEKIFDVAWMDDCKPDLAGKIPPIRSTVDIANASYSNSIGAVELKSVWTDPEFDPSQDAFYYARVLEIPTPRWTTIQAKELAGGTANRGS